MVFVGGFLSQELNFLKSYKSTLCGISHLLTLLNQSRELQFGYRKVL